VTTFQRGIFTIVLGVGIAAGGLATYKWFQSRNQRLAQEKAPISRQSEVTSVPPFATKEPARYQATRIITSLDGDSSLPPNVTRILIARDGDMRRQDYDSDTDLRTSYLEIPAGSFVLLPAKKLYTDIKSASASLALPDQNSDQQSETDADFSPEGLLNGLPGARYEKLGSESLEGRTTTKYRVSSAVSTNGTEAPTVTLIWIDESLGMPIRSETEASDGSHQSKLTIELRDIQLHVDPKLFELPKDYQRVEAAELRDWLKQALVGTSTQSPKP